MKTLYNNHPQDSKHYDTETLRSRYLMPHLFEEDTLKLYYSHHDRMITGGIMPQHQTLSLDPSKELATAYFLERREAGFINIGGPGSILIDGERVSMHQYDGCYLSSGFKEIQFVSESPSQPAKFYFTSAPGISEKRWLHIPFSRAKKVALGSPSTLNQRVIHQYVHPDVCPSVQLAMGMTVLAEGSVWNTMPCHIHDRRMEVYFYFDMAPETRVFHFMGEPQETRHLVMANEQALISPPWSIHSGVGTSSYRFIWSMAGENQRFDDMDLVPMSELR